MGLVKKKCSFCGKEVTRRDDVYHKYTRCDDESCIKKVRELHKFRFEMTEKGYGKDTYRERARYDK